MTRSKIEIGGEQRDALHELVLNHLASVGDLWKVIERSDDYATAERLAIEFGEDFRLMADLGWEPKDGRETVELTMAPLDLMEAARRLREDASGGLAEAIKDREAVAPRASVEGYERARDACEQIVAQITATYGGGQRARA